MTQARLKNLVDWGEEIDLLPDRTNAEPEKQRKHERFTNKERPEEKSIQYTTRGKR